MKKIFILSLILLSTQVFAWDFFKGNQGSMTGYSTPISNDIFKDLNINSNNSQNQNSPTYFEDLFSAPQTNYDYNKSGSLKQKETTGIGAKAGVRIIYD